MSEKPDENFYIETLITFEYADFKNINSSVYGLC